MQEIYDYQLDPHFIDHKLIDHEDRWTRNSLRVDGFKERPNETWKDGEKELDTL